MDRLLERAIPGSATPFVSGSSTKPYGPNAPIRDLVEKVVRSRYWLRVHPQRQPSSAAASRAIERRSPWAIGSSAANGLPTRCTRGSPHTPRSSLDRCADPAPPVGQREDPRGVGPAHHGSARRADDRPGISPARRPGRPRCGESQLVRPHHPQHPRPRDPGPVQDPQPRVDLPMAARPGTASGRDRPESPPAASRPTPWASDPAARALRPCDDGCSRGSSQRS